MIRVSGRLSISGQFYMGFEILNDVTLIIENHLNFFKQLDRNYNQNRDNSWVEIFKNFEDLLTIKLFQRWQIDVGDILELAGYRIFPNSKKNGFTIDNIFYLLRRLRRLSTFPNKSFPTCRDIQKFKRKKTHV